jgi:glycerol-3-phosphate acyltransferase PlsX
MTRVAVDAMGGDHAPRAVVAGALLAARDGIDVVLVGDEAALRRELASLGTQPPNVQLLHAPDAIGMAEHDALDARNRRESSIYLGLQLLRRGEVQAFVSAGNTGAVVTLALVVLGRLPGAERPALGALLPLPAGPCLLLDAGANAESRAAHLVQFGVLGAAYLRVVLGTTEPRVGLLSIGEEPGKGTPAVIEAQSGLRAAPGLRFLGNIEGRELTTGRADVVVTDGFTGNVALKLAEGVIEMMLVELRRAARSSWRGRIGGALLRPQVRRIADQLDYRRHGAAPLLGVDGAVFIAHGRSDATAIAHAVRAAAQAARQGLRDALASAIADVRAIQGGDEPAARGAAAGDR